MISKDQVVTLVSSTLLVTEEISNYFKKDLSFSVSKTNSLSENALDLYVNSLSDEDKQVLRKYFFSKKVDICIQDNSVREKKILLADMDATMIANETLDDLVKISGVKANIDETSRLAMEGKIDIRTTLSTRVNYLKDKPKSLIQDVLSKIVFHPGSDILIKTLNKKRFITSLVTGGFAPISTYVGDRLGFQNVISNEFKFENDCFTGEYIPITGEKNSKLNYLNKITQENGIDTSQVVAVGDGANDLGMLTNCGLGVGYHAHQIVRDQVENQIFFNDLTTILYYLGFCKEEFSLS
jgi:phosphoserine phosphatase